MSVVLKNGTIMNYIPKPQKRDWKKINQVSQSESVLKNKPNFEKLFCLLVWWDFAFLFCNWGLKLLQLTSKLLFMWSFSPRHISNLATHPCWGWKAGAACQGRFVEFAVLFFFFFPDSSVYFKQAFEVLRVNQIIKLWLPLCSHLSMYMTSLRWVTFLTSLWDQTSKLY